MSLPKRLQALRKRKGKLQKDVADYLDVSIPTYSNYEKGNRNPDPLTIKKLAEYFEVSTDYLLDKESNETKYYQNREKVLDIIGDKKITVNFKNFEEFTDDDIEKIKEDIELVLSIHRKRKGE